ncbi:MAG TPA: aldo/keto reductase [Phycisphaerae bacterium]|nr:aldo/keto reductase [Phycisphaerae bacterium]
MLRKPYGRTGKELTVIGCGGMRFAEPEKIDANAEVVLHAYERGINYFDTAPGYCKDHSEEIVGAAVKQMAPGTFYVSTKCSSESGSKLTESLERSLKRLNVEKIDFFHIWCVVTLDQWKRRGEAVKAALKAKEQGLVEHVAISSHLPGNELKGVLAEGHFEGVTLGYSAINFPYRQEAVESAGRMGLGVVAMNPLGGGLIPQNPERLDFLRGPNDGTVVDAALRFVVSSPHITTALVGFTTKQHVDEAVSAVEDFQPYPPEHFERMKGSIIEAFDDLCTGCGYCLPCPQEVQIPKLMDAYNHLLLGGNRDSMRSRLKWHWGLSPEAAAACSMCGECEDKCTQHLPIRERMKLISEIDEGEG